MVRASWSTGPDAMFVVRCECGAQRAARLTSLSYPPGAARPPLAVRQQRVERLAWAAFLHDARIGGCRHCLEAAGQWLRGERLTALAS